MGTDEWVGWAVPLMFGGGTVDPVAFFGTDIFGSYAGAIRAG